MRSIVVGILGALVGTACRPSSLVDVTPPGNVVDPATVNTPTAATQLYNGALVTFYKYYAGGSSVSDNSMSASNIVVGTGGIYRRTGAGWILFDYDDVGRAYRARYWCVWRAVSIDQ
jgi:hypothetical protein